MSDDAGAQPPEAAAAPRRGFAQPAPDERDPALVSPLARFDGERPPAPPWFEAALAVAPERSFTLVDGCPIETLAWGERGRPGLLFLHGNGAHADWWSFIAPFFAATHRCAAISWSGMGRSGWRERYGFDVLMREALQGAEAAGLFEAGPPDVAAHSFGGSIGTVLAAHAGERLRSMVILDAGVRPPEKRWKGPPRRESGHRVYPDLPAALARFRLMPPQTCENLFLLDHIARPSLHEVADGAPGTQGGAGWTWRFDPFFWQKFSGAGRMEQEAELIAAKCPIAFAWGDRSKLMQSEVVDYTRLHAPKGSPMLAIPQADHHVMLDQPLATVATLRGLLAGWPG